MERLADFQCKFLSGSCRSRSALILSQSPWPGTASYDTVTRFVVTILATARRGRERPRFEEFRNVSSFLPAILRRSCARKMEGLPEDSAVVSAQRNDPPISLRTAPIQVRRRRATVSSRPASPPPGIVPSTSDSPLAAYQGPSSPTDSPVDQNTNLGTFPRVTRRRGATITERLFSGDVYQGIGEDSGRTTRARAGTDAITRGRIGSVSSANSGGLRGRLGLGSDRGSTAGSELHADEEIDLVSRTFSSFFAMTDLLRLCSCSWMYWTILSLRLLISPTSNPPSSPHSSRDHPFANYRLRRTKRRYRCRICQHRRLVLRSHSPR